MPENTPVALKVDVEGYECKVELYSFIYSLKPILMMIKISNIITCFFLQGGIIQFF